MYPRVSRKNMSAIVGSGFQGIHIIFIFNIEGFGMNNNNSNSSNIITVIIITNRLIDKIVCSYSK